MYGPPEQPDEQGNEAASGLAAAKILSRSELDGRAAASQRLGTRTVSGTDTSVARESSASRQATYGPGADWSQFQGTAGRGNLTETSTGKTGMSSDRQPGQRRSERAMGHTSTTTGTLATPAAEGRQQDLSHAGWRTAPMGRSVEDWRRRRNLRPFPLRRVRRGVGIVTWTHSHRCKATRRRRQARRSRLGILTSVRMRCLLLRLTLRPLWRDDSKRAFLSSLTARPRGCVNFAARCPQ